MRSVTGLGYGLLVGAIVGAASSVTIGIGGGIWLAVIGEGGSGGETAMAAGLLFMTYGLVAGAIVGAVIAGALGFLLGLAHAEQTAPIVAVLASGLLAGAVLPDITPEGPGAVVAFMAVTAAVLALSFAAGKFFVRNTLATPGVEAPHPVMAPTGVSY